MSDNYCLPFIKQEDFENHVAQTIKKYSESLKSINLKKFNKNIIDPIKLTFDKALFKKEIENIIELELHRQRDKSNTNAIGYFHQNMFKYFENCKVPQQGFDVIFTRDDGVKIYVEMKNKHNTMNSSSGKNTYITMQNHILHNPNDICYLVEVIAKRSQNIEWKCSINKKKVSHAQIRRISIDKFYELVTGVENAFYLVCKQLPVTIEKLIKNDVVDTVEHDTVIDELKAKNPDLLKALYLLAFETYNGFDKLL
jgi:hypothetical protein